MKQELVKKEFLLIGEVARLSMLNIETIRFYERRGLLDPPLRKPSGYRQYPASAVDRLLFIKNAKELGFSLTEISELLSLKLHSKTKCLDVKEKAEKKIVDIETKIKSLQRMKKALTELSKACVGKGSVKDCPILDSLEVSKNGKIRK